MSSALNESVSNQRAQRRRGLLVAASEVNEARETAEAWVRIATDEEARSDGGSGGRFGFVPAMGRLLQAHPRIGSAFLGVYAEVMMQPGHLDRREREMVAAVTAAAQDCHY